MSYFAPGEEGKNTEYCEPHDEVKFNCAPCLRAQLARQAAESSELLRASCVPLIARAEKAEAALAVHKMGCEDEMKEYEAENARLTERINGMSPTKRNEFLSTENAALKAQLADMKAIAEKCLDPEYMAKLSKIGIFKGMLDRLSTVEKERDEARRQLAEAKEERAIDTMRMEKALSVLSTQTEALKGLDLTLKKVRGLTSSNYTGLPVHVYQDALAEIRLIVDLALATPEPKL